MLDQTLRTKIDPYLDRIATKVIPWGITPNQITGFGFLLGLASMAAISFDMMHLALALFLGNRICDGLDGSLARQKEPSAAGAYLYIVFDFIIYAGLVFAFAIRDPDVAKIAAFAIFSFVGSGSSFLAMAIFAHQYPMANTSETVKGFHYLAGLTEGFETMLFIVIILLIPSWFQGLGLIFCILCWITTVQRVSMSYRHLRSADHA